MFAAIALGEFHSS